jgi:hypothetical protein
MANWENQVKLSIQIKVSEGKLANQTRSVILVTFFGKFDTFCMNKVWVIMCLHPFFA